MEIHGDEHLCEWCTGGRRCGRAATKEFVDLKLCWHHHLYLADRIMTALMLDTSLRTRAAATIAEIRQVEIRDGKVKREEHVRRASLVYFVERDGFVKIGFAFNVPNRIREINRGSSSIPGMTVSPVRLLATMPGGKRNERWLHDRFAHVRVDGEWFLPDDEMWSFMRSLKDYVGGAQRQDPNLVTHG